MCYKNEIQDRYADKLEALFSEDNTPDFIRDYFVHLGSEGTKRNNYIKIRSMLNWMINNGFIKKNSISEVNAESMDNITTTHVIKYLDDLKTTGLKNSTISLYKDVLGGFWTYLVGDRYVSTNIIKRVPANKYKSRKAPVKIPTDYSLEKFIANILNKKDEFLRERNLTIVKLFIGSGIRKTELAGLDLDDLFLDDDEPCIMVLAKGDQDEELKESIPIVDTRAVHALKKYLEIRNTKFPNTSSQAVFLSREGDRLTNMGITKMFGSFSKDEINPHMLRHYSGTLLYEASGHDIQAVKDQLGHSDVKVTSDKYIATNKKRRYNVLDAVTQEAYEE